MDGAAERIAGDFIRRYESAWTEGAEKVAELYTNDSVLVGFRSATGRTGILRLLEGVSLKVGLGSKSGR